MQVVYDDIKTFTFSGDLKASFSDAVTLELEGFLVTIQMLNQRSLNLPTIQLNSSLDVVITEKWYAEQLCFMLEKGKI
jgi:hypothetical protein